MKAKSFLGISMIGICICSQIFYTGNTKVVKASQNSSDNLSNQEYIKILSQNGISEAQIECLGNEAIEEIAKAYIEDKESVNVERDVSSFDEIEVVQQIASVDLDDISIDSKCSKKELESIKDTIEKMKEISVEDLEEDYGMSGAEAKVFNEAVNANDYTDPKETKEELSLSSTIGASKLSITQYVINRSTGKEARYRVTTGWNWQKAYLPFDLFVDKVNISWDGDLRYYSNDKLKTDCTYNKMTGAWPSLSWKGEQGHKAASNNEINNNSIIVYIDQAKNHYLYPPYMKSGYVQFTIKNSKNKNRSGNVKSRYYHAVPGVDISKLDKKFWQCVTKNYDTTPESRAIQSIKY